MPDVKRKNLLMAVCTVLATVALAATLGGCAPSQPSGDAGNGGADAASYPVGSLKAVHVAGQLDDADEYPNKLCLSCHDRTTINAANEDARRSAVERKRSTLRDMAGVLSPSPCTEARDEWREHLEWKTRPGVRT